MPRNLLAELSHPEVDDSELLSVIAHHYSTAQTTDDNDVVYPSGDSYSLKVRCNEGQIVRIEPGPGFSEEGFQALKDKVYTHIIDSPGTGIEACILFSPNPVKGFFRSQSGLFQILPAPTNAPRPPYSFGDHPFVLEFPMRRSNDGGISVRRRMRSLTEWTWVINALVRPSIKCHGSRLQQGWVTLMDDPGPTPSIRWAQEMYHVEGFVGVREDFTPLGTPEIRIIPSNDYYARDYFPPHELTLPDNLEELIVRVSELTGDNRRRFYQAVQWFYVARELWDHHTSSYYIALIAAIESLAHRSMPADPCPACGKDRGPGPTQRFKDFVEGFGPPSGTTTISKRRLYELRSRLVHGKMLLQLDEKPWEASFNTTSLDERQAFEELSYIVREVLVHWLKADDAIRSLAIENSDNTGTGAWKRFKDRLRCMLTCWRLQELLPNRARTN